MYSTPALVGALAAAVAANAAALPPAGSPTLVARGSGVNVPIKHDPLSSAANPKTRREFFERNDLATRSKYLCHLEYKRQKETNTPYVDIPHPR